MAKTILRNCFISINGVDLSDHIRQVTVETTRDEHEVTGFSASKFKEILAGDSDATVSLEGFQDFAAAEIHATLAPLADSDTPFPVAIRPDNSAISATNPEAQMSALLFTYNFLDGARGEPSMTPITLRNASSTGLVYDITP